MSQELSNQQKRQFWEHHLSQQATTDLSQNEYCRLNNLRASRFTYWKIKLSKQQNYTKPSVLAKPSKFTKVQVSEAANTDNKGLSMLLPTGVKLFDISDDNYTLAIKIMRDLS